jgi:F1F0 ATPase subunit 2
VSDPGALILAAAAGCGLGLFFYAGLYFTVVHGLRSPRPALWFLSSFVLRMSLVPAAMYFVMNDQWQNLVACLCGFVVTGFVFQIWKARQPIPDSSAAYSPPDADRGSRHAP